MVNDEQEATEATERNEQKRAKGAKSWCVWQYFLAARSGGRSKRRRRITIRKTIKSMSKIKSRTAPDLQELSPSISLCYLCGLLIHSVTSVSPVQTEVLFEGFIPKCNIGFCGCGGRVGCRRWRGRRRSGRSARWWRRFRAYRSR